MTESLLQWYFCAGADDRDDRPRRIAVSVPTDVETACVLHPDSSDASDCALAMRIRLGDTEAFDTLTRIHLTALVRFAVSIVHSREIAEELVQDVLARLWIQRATMPATGSVRAVLFTAVRHRALNALKHDRVALRAVASLEHAATNARAASSDSRTPMPDAFIHDEAAQQTFARINQAIAALPERQRSAVTLRYSQGLRVAEIGAIMDVSTKAAEQLLVRALRTLRIALEDDPA